MNTYNQLAFGELGNLKSLLQKTFHPVRYAQAQAASNQVQNTNSNTYATPIPSGISDDRIPP